jgi:HSP20 family protein
MAKSSEGKQQMASSRSGEVQRMPSRPMTPFEEMERMFEGFMPRAWMRPFGMGPMRGEMMPMEGKIPAVDVINRDDEILLRAELPGIDKENIEITTTDDTVTIRGETSHEQTEDTDEYYRCEIARGAFSRTVALPADVDGSKAKAVFKEGMLELTLPKVERAKRHTIKVQ